MGGKNPFLYISCIFAGVSLYFFAFLYFCFNKLSNYEWGKGLEIKHRENFKYYSYELVNENILQS